MCNIIVTLHYVQAEERKFSTLDETQRAILSVMCGGKTRTLFS